MQSETAEFRWDFREIRSRIRRTIFTKGLKPYLVLVLVVFILCVAFVAAFLVVKKIVSVPVDS